MRKKERVTEEEIKEELLGLSKKEIEFNTKYIIEFEDFGQDFLRWYINEDGYVIDSQPFQRWVWVGKFTIPQTAKVGEKLAIWNDGESYVNYPIKTIEVKK
jgi:hypothetical protein